MGIILILILLIVSSHTYIAYICFILIMLNVVFFMYLLGYLYLALIYTLIYIGSIAILFAYILMMLSITIDINYGHILFISPTFISLFYSMYIFGNFDSIYYLYYDLDTFNILSLSYFLYTDIMIPIGLLLFLGMFFVIKYI